MKYAFIHSHRSAFGVGKMCRVLAVSRSGYYGWRQRGESPRARENHRLLTYIHRTYEASRGCYGSPRITDALHDQGFSCSRPRVARLMRQNNIRAKTTRKFKVTTNAAHNFPVAPNRLQQRFQAAAPNRIWVSDITYVPTLEGWLYLTVVLDLFSRKVAGWSMSDRMLASETTLPAFKMALQGNRPLPGLVFHSDRGVQYACDDFVQLLRQARAIQSMSSTGSCYDNAVAESFFRTVKIELVYHERYRTRAEARLSLFAYLEGFYNRVRKHSTLGYKSPLEFENHAYRKAV